MAITHKFIADEAQEDPLVFLAIFSAAGLFVSVLLMTYGVDLSPGFF